MELHRRVEALLEAHERAGAFLEEAVTATPRFLRSTDQQNLGPTARLSAAPPEKSGSRTGRYKLLGNEVSGDTVAVWPQVLKIQKRIALSPTDNYYTLV